MKRIYLLTTLLFLLFINLSAQTVTITGSCFIDVDGDYTLASDINGKASYTKGIYVIQWSGTRWEHISNGVDLGMHNDANTTSPPASSFSPWVSDMCIPAGTFTGNGASSIALSINEVKLSNVKIYPNPTANFIFIAGIEDNISYKIYNTLGVEIFKGNISGGNKIDVRYLPSGFYFLKFEEGNTLRFIKK